MRRAGFHGKTVHSEPSTTSCTTDHLQSTRLEILPISLAVLSLGLCLCCLLSSVKALLCQDSKWSADQNEVIPQTRQQTRKSQEEENGLLPKCVFWERSDMQFLVCAASCWKLQISLPQ